MDSLLKLKLEMVYRDFPVEQARLRFEELKVPQPPPPERPIIKVKRKLRIPGQEVK